MTPDEMRLALWDKQKDRKVPKMGVGGAVAKGVANVGKRLLQDAPVAPKVKPPSDNVANVRQANFRYPKTVGNQTVGIDKLSGGVRMSDPNEVKRVKALADQIASPEGYISRIIVDHNDNVIEGQHRLEALRQLGIKDVPVYKIEEMADTMPVDQMESAVQGIGAIHPDHVGQIINHALESIASEGVEGARQMDLGRFQKHYNAALDAITSDVKKANGGLVHMGAGGKIVKGLIGAGRRLTSTEKAASDAIGKAAESAGVNPPVMADKMYPPLTNLQDSYTSLGDKIRARVIEAQKQMDTFDYKYNKGQRVFTEDSAKKNRAPYEILQRHRMGNDIVQEDPNNPFSKKVIDPETGKAQRTPYEPAYWVRSKGMENPEEWSEFLIPQTAIKGDVEMAKGGLVHMAPGGVVKWASQLAKTINSHKMESMSGEQWMKWLNANAPKSAKKEALASGTLDWLPQQGKVSKGAIIEHMKANAPQIKVKKFYENHNPELQARYADLHDTGWTSGLTHAEREEMQELELKLEPTTKFHDDNYRLPGGSNYREMTLSARNPTGDNYIVPGAHTYGITEADVNRILHMRMNDRPHKGGKALNIEELQSDWAQRGRSEGFKKPPTIISEEIANRHNTLRSKLRNNEVTPEELSELADIRLQLRPKINRGLPSGPYVTDTEDWTRLGLHNAIKEATEQGHNAVTWTGGDAQAKRYDLSKQLNEVHLSGSNLKAYDHNGDVVVSQTGINKDNIADYIGKEAANKLLAQEPTNGLRSLTGQDLQVGGEGMMGYYDKIVPSTANDILKKMGVAERVGEFDVGTGVPHQGFNITPEMLDYIVSNGLPRFKSGGPVKMGVGGIVKELVKAAAPKLATKAPEIIKPSELSKLKAYLLQRQGAHGARRVERAADEVPNLQQMYTPRALQDAFNGGWHSDNASAVMIMNPAHFENYAQPILEYTDHDLNITNPTKYVNTLAAREKHIKELQSVKGFDEVPWLQLGRLYGGEQGSSIIPAIYVHDGRHRSRALARNGEEISLVRAELGDLPRSWQEEYVGALNKEMQRADNKVVPQVYNVPANNSGSIESFEQGKLITRPAIQLPEMFAKGGAVHMQGGGTPFNDSPHKGMSHTTPARGMTEDELRNTMKPYEYEAPLDEPLISPDMAIGTGLPTAIAKLLGKGVMGAGKALAPVGNQFLEDYMARQGMTLSAAPTKRGVVSSLNDNANTASAAKYKPAGVMNSAEKPEPMLASKAYNEIMGETVSPTSVADRMIVRPGTSKEKGGSMFPWLSTVDPNYEGTVWANKGAGAASRMINTANENEGVIFTPQIGSPEMHRSNQVVYEKILRAFDRAKAEGKLTPELMRAYNDRLKSFYENDKGGQLFQPNFDIGATNLRKEATTFPHRAAIAEVLGGKGLRAYGYKNREAAQIVPYNKILQSTTEPQSLGAATGSLGPRFFQLSGERSYRPDLHSAFPEMVGGTDLGIQYPHTARDLVFTDFIKKIEASKGRPIGHMDWDKNRVLQKVRPETVYRLEDMGLKAGGAVHMSEGGATNTGGKFSHEALLAKTKADEPIHEQVQRYLDMMKVDAAGGRDVYGTNLYGRAKMDIPVGKATVSPYLEGSAYRPAGQTFSGQLTGAGVNVTLPFKQGGDVGVSRDTMMIELMNKGKR